MPRLVFGASVRRVEDPPLLRGEGRYVDDLQPSDCLHAVFLRSHLAHALIRSIDIEAASKATGVVAVWSAPDFIDLEPLEIESAVDGMTIPERRVLASGRVRHVGEALAMLIAESAAQARDALELVELDLDPLPAVTDVERALQEGAQLLYPEFGTNLAFQNASRHGPVKRSFDRAQVIVRERLLNQRLIPAALEPRGALAWLDDERLTLQISSQSTFGVREAVAASLGIDEKDLRVIVGDVGGGFGSKGGCLGEEIAVAAAARRLRRPVKWIEERWENCAVTWHGRGQLQEVELAAQRDGTVLAIRSRIVADMGAHLEPYSAFVPTVTPDLQTGCYRIPASQNTIQGVYTNKAPTGPYRGAGRPEAAFLIERMMDRLATELNIDPVELRLRNFVSPADFPYTNAAGLTYDSGDYSGALGRLVEVSGYQRLRELQANARAQGQLHGIGVATYVEVAAGEPADRATARLEAPRPGTSNHLGADRRRYLRGPARPHHGRVRRLRPSCLRRRDVRQPQCSRFRCGGSTKRARIDGAATRAGRRRLRGRRSRHRARRWTGAGARRADARDVTERTGELGERSWSRERAVGGGGVRPA